MYRYLDLLCDTPLTTAQIVAYRATCDNERMSDDASEIFPIAFSTAYLSLAALLTMREDVDGSYCDETRQYVTRVLQVIKAQPETVLNLQAAELEEMGPHLLDNASAWLDD